MNNYLRPYRTFDFLKDSSFKEVCNHVHNNNYENGFYQRMNEEGFFENQQMKIISEFGEMFDARRKENFSSERIDIKYVLNNGISRDDFKKFIKDSFEDELADLMIYSMDWIGSPLKSKKHTCPDFENWRLDFLKGISTDDFKAYKAQYYFLYNRFYLNPNNIIQFCKDISEEYNINLEYHVYSKLEYNTTRGKMHGKTS